MSNEYICYAGVDSHNLEKLDEYFRNIAMKLNAEYFHIPALIEKSVLERCGYLSSFPHHLTIASYYDPNKYNEVAVNGKYEKSNILNSELFFTPAACLHFYPMLENQVIDKKVITTRARVYRYENNRFDGKCRIWDFTVREIVFVGTNDFVQQNLAQIKKITLDYINKIGLDAELRPANDNFYPSTRNNIKGKLQLSNSLKDELVCKIDGEEVAIASFNTHGYHFSKPFNFDNNGSIVSGCVGYGLERWVAALKSRNITL